MAEGFNKNKTPSKNFYESARHILKNMIKDFGELETMGGIIGMSGDNYLNEDWLFKKSAERAESNISKYSAKNKHSFSFSLSVRNADTKRYKSNDMVRLAEKCALAAGFTKMNRSTKFFKNLIESITGVYMYKTDGDNVYTIVRFSTSNFVNTETGQNTLLSIDVTMKSVMNDEKSNKHLNLESANIFDQIELI